ncbi:MAG: hypothetical protein VW421_01645 [Gammaproteobacteria bacterium]
MKKLFDVSYDIYGDDGWCEKSVTIRAKDRDNAKMIVSAMEHHSVFPIEICCVAELGKIA